MKYASVSRVSLEHGMAAAINYSVSIPGGGDRYLYHYGVLDSHYTIGGITSAYAKESRPATVHSQRSSSGWRPPLPWSHSKYVYSQPYIDCVHESGAWRDVLASDGRVFTLSSVTGNLPDLGNCVDRAINKALLQLSNQQTDLGENFAEREQADRMIGDRIDKYTSQLTGRYISRHRKDWRRVKKVSPLVRHGMKYPESWLEFQYGVVPLLSDIYGAYKVFKDVDSDNQAFRCSVKANVVNDKETVVSTVSLEPTDYALLGPNGQADFTVEKFSGAFVRLDYCMRNPALVALQQIGVVNPALLAWNLLPYSFVVDWFLPIGNYLQSWTADLGWDYLGGSVSTIRRMKGSLSNPRPYSWDTDVSVLQLSRPGYCYGFEFNRTVLPSSPAPRMPHFKNPLSLSHAASAMSLLVTALHRS